MEVTSIEMRAAHGSADNSAARHERTSSPPRDATTPEETEPRREWPVNIAVEKLASTLRSAAPSLDPSIATNIAKELLAGYASAVGPVEKKKSADSETHVDLKA